MLIYGGVSNVFRCAASADKYRFRIAEFNKIVCVAIRLSCRVLCVLFLPRVYGGKNGRAVIGYSGKLSASVIMLDAVFMCVAQRFVKVIECFRYV